MEVGLMRITSKGQVTIPMKIREKFGLLPNTEVEFEVDGDVLRMRKVEVEHTRGRELISKIRGKATTVMSTEEIMALTRND